jgi:uncharacterized membrane protein YeaQ/YmgE (transglycosylase-associated protein family)
VIVLILLLAIVLVFVLGIAILGLVFKLLWLALVGLVIGALARAILPGRQEIGVLATALYGIGGSLLGGVIAHIFGLGNVLEFVAAIGVAAALIAFVGGRSRPTY